MHFCRFLIHIRIIYDVSSFRPKQKKHTRKSNSQTHIVHFKRIYYCISNDVWCIQCIRFWLFFFSFFFGLRINSSSASNGKKIQDLTSFSYIVTKDSVTKQAGVAYKFEVIGLHSLLSYGCGWKWELLRWFSCLVLCLELWFFIK